MSVYIHAIGTAVPNAPIPQTAIAQFMNRALGFTGQEARKLELLYQKTMIKQRHSVLSDYETTEPEKFNFYPKNKELSPFPSVAQRMQAYQKAAAPLAKAAIEKCVSAQQVHNLAEVTHLITVSCTGMYAPGLDIDLVLALGLNTSVERTAINFMGCYGAFNGLKVANAICEANAQAVVLVVCVELCTLHFQKENNPNFLFSNALFADGAATCLLSAKPSKGLKINTFHCELYTQGLADMQWYIGNTGFEMVLTEAIPKTIQLGIKQTVATLLKMANLPLETPLNYAIHPGGKAILQGIEQALGLEKSDNAYSYEILENYGNISSATVLFVLEKYMNNPKNNKPILSTAFGPGLTLESMILEL
jgi:alpha-pyrone synthase